MHFKEIVFARIRRHAEDKNRHTLSLLEPLKRAISEFQSWSWEEGCYRLKQSFLNFENKSIFNEGIVVRELPNDRWEVQIVLTTPLHFSTLTASTDFEQSRNFVNYNYEKHLFYSNPFPFFQSLDYKELSKVDKSDIEYYCSHIHGLEVLVYPRQGFIQINESYPLEIEREGRVSLGKKLLIQLRDFLSAQKIIVADQTLKPDDFVDIQQS